VCHGQKQTLETAVLKVKVPPGVDNDTQIRLTGEGGPGLNGGLPGSVYVVIHVRPHKFFKRRGNDIFLDLQINVAQAALGDTILIPTLDGDEEFEIQAGTQPGEVIKLRNKGVPRLDRSGRGVPKGRGDQHVIVQVAIPKKLNDQQRELFQKLGNTLGSEVTPHERGFWAQFKDTIGDVFNI
jgi:molecular chaperone DnaJ